MTQDAQIVQDPLPGTRMISFCGDLMIFTLTLPQSQSGTAWVRTNIGHAEIIRDEIVREVEKNDVITSYSIHYTKLYDNLVLSS